MELTEPVFALIAAVFGGAGLKVIESLFKRAGERADIASQIRSELRQEVLDLRETVHDIDERLESWRRQYYAALVAFNELSVIAINHGLSDEVAEVRQRLEDAT